VAKIGRNDPCPCRSGRKFKHCCLDTNRNNKSLLPSGVEEVHEAPDLLGGKTPREAAHCEADRDQHTRHCSKVLRTPSGVTRWRRSSRPMICNG